MGVWSMLLSSGSLNILFWLFIIIVVFALVGWGIFVLFMKFFVYKYRFGIIGYTGRINLLRGKVVRTRHGVRKFSVKGYKDKLDVVEPNSHVDSKPCRLVSFDGMGNLAYIKNVQKMGNLNSQVVNFKVSKKEYLLTALKPVERESMCYNEIENTRRHGSMPTEVKWAFGFSFLLVIVVVMGLFVQGKVLAKSYEISSKDMGTLIMATETLDHTAQVIAENTKMQQVIMSYMDIDYNISFVAE